MIDRRELGRKIRRLKEQPTAILPRQPFGFLPGYADTSQATVMVVSLSNAPITVSCQGVTVTPALTAIGTDAPAGHPMHGKQAGFIGHATFTHLSQAGRRYPLEVQQGTATQRGALMTAPAPGTECALYFLTCINNTSLGGVPGGFFQSIREQIEAPSRAPGITAPGAPVAGIMVGDDSFGYWDLAVINDAANTGHYFTADGGGTLPRETNLEYDYALGILACFGLFGGDNVTDPYMQFGRHPGYRWCQNNINWLLQRGDHDSGGLDMGYAVDSASSPLFAVCDPLYRAVFAPLHPPTAANRDTSALHWACDIGDMRLVAPDGVQNGDGTAPAAASVLFGNNQIDDCLDALNTAAAFKLPCMPYSVRELAATGTPNNMRGAQNPIDGMDEFKRFFTAIGNTPPSIMDNHNTNGTNAALVALHGDYHFGLVTENHKPAYAGNAAESWISIHAATATGSFNFGKVSSIVDGLNYNGETEVLWIQKPNGTADGRGEHRYHGTRLFSDGGNTLTVEHWNEFRTLNWSGVFAPGSNLPA